MSLTGTARRSAADHRRRTADLALTLADPAGTHRSAGVAGTDGIRAGRARLHGVPSAPRGGAGSGSRSGPEAAQRASAASRSVSLASYVASRDATPRQIARWLLTRRFGWPGWQFEYLNLLWSRESGWNPYAYNTYSGAYGIPQAVPGDKMASAGGDWQSSARTQILWGMRYIKERYGTPYAAWRHESADGWY